MNENERRAALESVRKDANDPTLSVGDVVFCGGVYATVTDIQTWQPGQHGNSPIRNDWMAVQVTTDTGGSRWQGREPQAPAVHIHVGQNIPGYLPESDVMCFDSVEGAMDALKQAIKDQQDYYYERCTAETPEQQEKGSDCCGWCDVASDCEAAIGAIADGDAAYQLGEVKNLSWIFRTPEGPDMHHWATFALDPRDDCEVFADQEGYDDSVGDAGTGHGAYEYRSGA